MPFTDSITGASVMDFLEKTAPGTNPAPLDASRTMDQLASLAQSRLVSFFSAAYFSADARIIGLMMLLSAWYTPGCTFHFLPSQLWIVACASPAWLTQLVLTGVMKPVKPSFLISAALISRFSSPQRTSEPLRGFLPYLT